MQRINWVLVTFIAGAFAAISLVTSVWLLRSGIIRVSEISNRDRTLTVTGSTRERVRSDKVLWRATVSARGPQIADAARKLREDVAATQKFIVGEGIAEKETQLSAVQTNELTRNVISEGQIIGRDIVGYELSQSVEVDSGDIDRVTRISRDVTKLIEQGVQVASQSPDYLYTNLADLKIKLVKGAAEDARTRASQITIANGSQIGKVASARVGVVQVNAANDSAVTWEGVSDKSAIEKDAFVTVSTTYYVE